LIAVHAVMNKRLLIVTLLGTWLAVAGAPVAFAAPVSQPSAASASVQRPARAATRGVVQPDRARDAARYAAAERARPDAARFEGGAVVIIGPTVALVLGVLLLLVLL
jgi:hypothetical protein